MPLVCLVFAARPVAPAAMVPPEFPVPRVMLATVHPVCPERRVSPVFPANRDDLVHSVTKETLACLAFPVPRAIRLEIGIC